MLCFSCEVLSVQIQAGISNKTNLFFLPGNFPGLPSDLVSHCQQNWEKYLFHNFCFFFFSLLQHLWVFRILFDQISSMRGWQDFFPLHDHLTRKISLFLTGSCAAVSVAVQFLVTLPGCTRSLQKSPQVHLCSERCAELRVLKAKGAIAWLSQLHPIFPAGCRDGVAPGQRRGLVDVCKLQGWSEAPEKWCWPAWRVSPSLSLGGAESTAQSTPRATPSVKNQG